MAAAFISGADLTFAGICRALVNANVKSKAPREMKSASGPLILTVANKPPRRDANVRIGPLAMALAVLVSLPSGVASAAPIKTGADSATLLKASAVGVRHHRQPHRVRRPYTYYYARPVYYRPYPYATLAPFTFGLNFGPW